MSFTGMVQKPNIYAFIFVNTQQRQHANQRKNINLKNSKIFESSNEKSYLLRNIRL